jgi:protein tyrosine phosphatase
MVVHCSAGVGRTGTLIAIDHNLDMAAKTNTVDILKTMNLMRRQRSTMVQTEEQYIFIYRVMADACSFNMTDMSPSTLREHFAKLRDPLRDGTSSLDSEFRRLTEGAQLGGRTDSGQMAVNKNKNRFQTILPLESSRVRLIPIPGVIGSDYINASFIDGFKHKGTYIAAQGPLDSTIGDFWRMIWEREVHSILMMTSESEANRHPNERYWPEIKGTPSRFGEYEIYLLSERNLSFVIERSLRVVDLVSETSREVKQWQFQEWSENKVPPNGHNVLATIDMIDAFAHMKLISPQEDSLYGNASAIYEDDVAKQIKPLVIHCNTGLGRTGTLCAILICLKRLQEEQKVDLYTVCARVFVQSVSYSIADRQAHANAAHRNGSDSGLCLRLFL